MEKEITTNEYIEKVKGHLIKPPKNTKDYFEFYNWLEDNEPIEYAKATDEIFELSTEAEPWTDIENFIILDKKLKNILERYNEK